MRLAFPLILATFALAACGDNPAGGPATPGEVVLTAGVAAPPRLAVPPAGPLRSDLAGAASLGGSTTTPVSLSGANCATFPAQSVTVTYTITGRQDSPASFKVNTRWVYNGAAFAGSNPVTLNVAARPVANAPATIIPVSISVENGTTGGSGAASFTSTPFGVSTTSPAALNVSGGGVTVHVEFSACAAANTPPTLVLPADMVVEATSGAGADVDYAAAVTAGDAEDGDLTASVACTPASGATFPLGETTVSCSVTDSGALSANGSFEIRVRDTTAPVFSGVPAGDVVLIAANINGATLDIASLGISAADVGGVSPPATISCTAADASAHPSPNTSAPVSFTVRVTLNVSPAGFLSPLRMAAPFSAHKLGSTIPHKFPAPTYADGTPATDLAGGLRLVLRNTGNASESYDATVTDYSAGSTAWRYEDGQYVFNAKSAKSWGAGLWQTTASYAGIVLASTSFSLRP
jgi:hypothetical protein